MLNSGCDIYVRNIDSTIFKFYVGPAKLTCEANQFMCDSGECLAGHKQCDGHVDCTDESDEVNCSKSLIIHLTKQLCNCHVYILSN